MTALGLAAAVTGGTRLLQRMDAKEAYAQAAAQLEQVDQKQSEAFLQCALPDLQRSQIDSPTALHTAIEIASEAMDKRYGQVIEDCSSHLDNLEQAVNRIHAPPDMTRNLLALTNAADGVSRTWNNYRVYLQQPGKEYDYVQALPLIEKITLAWHAYQTAETATQKALAAAR